MLQSEDSSYWAERIQFDHWRGLGEVEKAEFVRRLGRQIHAVHVEGLRELHPDADDRELELRAAAARLGADVVRECTGFDAEA